MAKKALVVDNDFFFVEFLTELLENRDYEVVKGYNGKEGAANFEQGPYDVLFVDLIMPKIDGIQLIKLARKRFSSEQMAIIAVSGTLIEQIDDIGDIGADYFVVKGPLEKMKGYIGEVLDALESSEKADRPRGQFVDPGKLYPRQATVELVDELNFQKAVFDSIGIGILVVDHDGRIIRANASILDLFKRVIEDLLNLKITDVFAEEGRGRLLKALKEAARNPCSKQRGMYLMCDAKKLKLTVSSLKIENDPDGWIVAIEDVDSQAKEFQRS